MLITMQDSLEQTLNRIHTITKHGRRVWPVSYCLSEQVLYSMEKNLS